MRSSWIVALTGLIAPLVHAAPSTPPELEVRACIPQGGKANAPSTLLRSCRYLITQPQPNVFTQALQANAAITCLASGILVATKRAVFVHKQ